MQYNHRLLKQFERYLKIRNYSTKTVKAYLGCLKVFFDKTTSSPKQINPIDVENFLLGLYDKKYSYKTVNLYYNSIKSYMLNILGTNLGLKINKTRGTKRLPQVLSKNEVKSIIQSITNKKHKLIISLAYGAGLRVSEITNLKILDLDFENYKIFISNSKGSKDRFSILPRNIILDLKTLIIGKDPINYLFESSRGGKLTTRTCQKIFNIACKKVGIHKKVSFHTLRHSFATHLLESGLDVTFVQKLLGHSSIKTTQTYLHIANTHLSNISSPLDT